MIRSGTESAYKNTRNTQFRVFFSIKRSSFAVQFHEFEQPFQGVYRCIVILGKIDAELMEKLRPELRARGYVTAAWARAMRMNSCSETSSSGMDTNR